jgi:dolichol-phosphate mannosyltransferase
MISVLLPTYNERENIKNAIANLKSVLKDIGQEYEIIVIDAGSADTTQKISEESGARVVVQKNPGYGAALKEGFLQVRGDYIITMDTDLSHDPLFIKDMWLRKDRADLIIASRYLPGGKSDAACYRKALSLILNKVFSFALSLPFKDLSSGFRMYRKTIIQGINCAADGFDFLLEILIRIYDNGGKIEEIPFHYFARKEGKSHVKLLKFAKAYFFTLLKMWKYRRLK